jgi:hypothetical protein
MPLPYLTRSIVFNASFSSATNFGTESFGFGSTVCKKVTDLDGDGKGNAVDTDSDGDGCSDFVEAKTDKNTTLTELTIGGTYGVNGFSSLVENNEADSSHKCNFFLIC